MSNCFMTTIIYREASEYKSEIFPNCSKLLRLNFGLWLSRVGFAVHGYVQKFFGGMSQQLNWYCLILRRDYNVRF